MCRDVEPEITQIQLKFLDDWISNRYLELINF